MPFALHITESRDQLADIVCDMTATAILDDVRAYGLATMMLSGGSTPKAAYSALSMRALPWDKVDLGLVDDRWVDEHDVGSNAAMIRRTLLQDRAALATFFPMKTNSADPFAAQPDVERTYRALARPYSLVILGMGPDGHTASWFPNARGLTACLDPNNNNIVEAVTAQKSDVTGDYLHRMTLTRSAITDARRAVLLLTGAEKRAVFEAALSDPKSRLPIRAAIDALGSRLTVLFAE